MVRRWPKAPPRGALGEYAESPRSDLRSTASLSNHNKVVGAAKVPRFRLVSPPQKFFYDLRSGGDKAAGTDPEKR